MLKETGKFNTPERVELNTTRSLAVVASIMDSSAAETEPKRRRLRFSLLALLIAVTVFSCLMGFWQASPNTFLATILVCSIAMIPVVWVLFAAFVAKQFEVLTDKDHCPFTLRMLSAISVIVAFAILLLITGAVISGASHLSFILTNYTSTRQ